MLNYFSNSWPQISILNMVTTIKRKHNLATNVNWMHKKNLREWNNERENKKECAMWTIQKATQWKCKRKEMQAKFKAIGTCREKES
jgi:hypothetical protein